MVMQNKPFICALIISEFANNMHANKLIVQSDNWSLTKVLFNFPVLEIFIFRILFLG